MSWRALGFQMPFNPFVKSPTSRALAIPELLDIIFSHLDPPSIASNACVSKAWSEVALNVLWSDVDDLKRLIGLLVPLKNRNNAFWELTRSPQPSDWHRFSKYATRVRRLSYNTHPSLPFPQKIHSSVFSELGRTRLNFQILPFLKSLEWITSSMEELCLGILFMHDRVRKFTVWLPESPLPEFSGALPFEEGMTLEGYFDDISIRMSRITHIDIRSLMPSRILSAPLLKLIPRLQNLEKIILPNYHLTTPILEELGRLPSLGVIQFEYGDEQGEGNITDVLSVQPTLYPNAFPSLYDLSLSATLSDITRLLTIPFGLSNLTSLYVDCPSIQKEAEMRAFVSVVSGCCQLLKALYVDCLWVGAEEVATAEDMEKMGWETIRGLLDCPNLTEFVLTHPYPLQITQSNIEELASKWPSLEMLVLACEPIHLTSPTPAPIHISTSPSRESSSSSPEREFQTETELLTLQALLPFARYCPNLRTLGLYIDASIADIPTNINPKRFKRLRKLTMGVSPISDPGGVALFLSKICPLGVEIECGVTWFDEISTLELNTIPFQPPEVPFIPGIPDPIALQAEVSKRCGIWREANTLLPLLTKLRIEETQKGKARDDEVSDLRVRNQILMERMGMGVSMGRNRKVGGCIVM